MRYSDLALSQLLEKYEFMAVFLEENSYEFQDASLSFEDYLNTLSEQELEDKAIDVAAAIRDFNVYAESMIEFLGLEENTVQSLSILPGFDKSGVRENFDELTIYSSQIISIVGPTGAGKSRLLQDIEWTADRDTPTKRKILINGEEADKKWRFSPNNSLVAQLSQNMNFVMDLKVREFLELHAKSRLVENVTQVVEKVIFEGNKLAGEKFRDDTDITALSGGQSRALMIADTAIISSSPIVLIDEIENAGIDRKKALDLLVAKDKIVLMATHDPTLALIADRRIIINNGGIAAILNTNDDEKRLLVELEKQDVKAREMRRKLRYGMRLGSEDF